MRLRKYHFSLRWHLRRWLGIPALEASYINNMARIHENEVKLKKEIDDIRTTGFLGVDLGYHETSKIVLLHYNCANDAWKVIADTEIAGERYSSYHRVVKELRNLIYMHNVKFAAVDMPAGAPSIKHKLGLTTDHGFGTEKKNRGKIEKPDLGGLGEKPD